MKQVLFGYFNPDIKTASIHMNLADKLVRKRSLFIGLQVQAATEELERLGAKRAETSIAMYPTPVVGLNLSDVNPEYKAAFGENLAYEEFGVTKLVLLLAKECTNIVKCPVNSHPQFCRQV